MAEAQRTATMPANQFAGVASDVQQSPPAQRTERLIDGIAHQMQQSGNTQCRQMGDELEAAKPQLVRALQQQAA